MIKTIIVILGAVALGIGQIESASWTTYARCGITGEVSAYECVGESQPPLCQAYTAPNGTGCGRWTRTFLDIWNGVPCPPGISIKYKYYLSNGAGGYSMVNQWTTSDPSGSCEGGYESNTTLALRSPNCHLITDGPKDTFGPLLKVIQTDRNGVILQLIATSEPIGDFEIVWWCKKDRKHTVLFKFGASTPTLPGKAKMVIIDGITDDIGIFNLQPEAMECDTPYRFVAHLWPSGTASNSASVITDECE